MATPKQIEAFDRALASILDETIGFEDAVVRQVVRELRLIRVDIAAAILNADGFEQLHFQAIKNDVEKVFRRLTDRLNGELDEATRAAFGLGQRIVDSPFAAAGGAIEVSALPQISIQALAAQIERGTTFISNLTSESANRINGIIQLGISGQSSPNKIMKEIGTVLTDRSTFKSIADRAEMITRTEINTALNTATRLRGEQAAEQMGGLKKFWIHTLDKRTRPEHVAVGRRTNPGLGGKPIPMKRKFIVGGRKGKGPHDPNLGSDQVIGCRCRLGFKLLKSSRIQESIGVFV